MAYRPIFSVLIMLAAGPVSAGSLPNPVLLVADFNDRTLNVQIGSGGAVVGEPVSISSGLQAVVRPAGVLPTPSLQLKQSATGAARFATFEFLGGEEVTTGKLSVFMVLKPATLDRFLVGIREGSGGAAKEFASLLFKSDGEIALNDVNPTVTLSSTYSAGQVLVFEFIYDLDAGTYDLLLNNVRLIDDRAHGVVGRGIGSVWIGTDPATASTSALFLDDLSVTRPSLLAIFDDSFEF
ncbi:MAG: hypothetical protein IPF83_14270 [Rhodanobacteraceae bacterium]|nr:hypothetical protein [Rhodanobacteraceae bacterium]MBP9154927.1 hypothetical protein [Xanthomonadales bacterium]HQW80426.1 hypothetical protein [Pseudomonadota bacterium]